MADNPLLKIERIKKYFPVRTGLFSRVKSFVRAVDDVDLEIWEGETVGLLGESGCGKTTLGKTVIRLIEPTSGRIFFDGENITTVPFNTLRELRKQMQIIFQDPYGSLNPRMRVEDIVGEGLAIHAIVPRAERRDEIRRLLEEVGLGDDSMERYPHEFSGGQRQRIAIARALGVRPRFIVCDEPVSALDVSVQAQIVNLLLDLQEQHGLTYLFISHDLRIVHHISDRVVVMYLGKVVEKAGADELYGNPLHPYTLALLSAIPVADPDAPRRKSHDGISGDVPNPIDPPPGCRFHTRCPIAEPRCSTEEPALREVAPSHSVACHLV